VKTGTDGVQQWIEDQAELPIVGSTASHAERAQISCERVGWSDPGYITDSRRSFLNKTLVPQNGDLAKGDAALSGNRCPSAGLTMISVVGRLLLSCLACVGFIQSLLPVLSLMAVGGSGSLKEFSAS